MPTINRVGEIIEHKTNGKGIILGCEHKRQYGMFYHVYFEDRKTFGYAASFKTIQQPTDVTRKYAQDILLQTLNNHVGRFQYGDIVNHPKFGTGIVLCNGIRRGGRIYYHVFYPKTQTFGYNSTFSLVQESNDKTYKKAKDILFNNVLIPAF